MEMIDADKSSFKWPKAYVEMLRKTFGGSSKWADYYMNGDWTKVLGTDRIRRSNG